MDSKALMSNTILMVEDVIKMRYTEHGVAQEYEFEDSRLDELLTRADAKFLRPMTMEELDRFSAILNRAAKAEAAKKRKR